MNVSSLQPSTSNGYAKYQIRSSGVPRLLATESDVFSLDDNEVLETRDSTEETRCVSVKEAEKSRLFDCPLDSDEEKEKEEEEDKGQHIRTHNNGSLKERSRLTDSFDLDGDSLEDELDLLPPLPGASSPNWSLFSKLHQLNCCNPRIPSKCTIM